MVGGHKCMAHGTRRGGWQGVVLWARWMLAVKNARDRQPTCSPADVTITSNPSNPTRLGCDGVPLTMSAVMSSPWICVLSLLHSSLSERPLCPAAHNGESLPYLELSVAVKICYASSILFEISKEYLTRKFLTALCEESGDGFKPLLTGRR